MEATERKMHRDHAGKMIAGVCVGLAEQLRIDPTIVRVLFVVGLAVSGGMAIGVYLLFWALTPARAGMEAPAARTIEKVSRWFSDPAPNGQPVREDPPHSA